LHLISLLTPRVGLEINDDDEADLSSVLDFTSDRPFNDTRYHINDSKLKSLGWAPQISFESGLLSTIFWYNSNNPSVIWPHYDPSVLSAHPKKKLE